MIMKLQIYSGQGLIINDFVTKKKCNKTTLFRAKIADIGCIQISNAVKHPHEVEVRASFFLFSSPQRISLA